MGYKLTGMYIGNQKVRPSQWRPGANTVCYYPLDGDMLDYSGNGYNGTGWTENYTTLPSGLKVANFTGSSGITTGFNQTFSDPDFTILFWYKRGNRGSMTFLFAKGTSGTGGSLHTGFYADDQAVYSFYGDNNPSWYVTDTTDWHLMGLTYSGNTKTCYLDTETPQSFSNNPYVGFNSSLTIGLNSGYYFNGLCSRLIWENRERTAQEIADYYDQTKGDYGIS